MVYKPSRAFLLYLEIYGLLKDIDVFLSDMLLKYYSSLCNI